VSKETIVEIAKLLDDHKDAFNFYLYMKALEPMFVVMVMGIICFTIYKIAKEAN